MDIEYSPFGFVGNLIFLFTVSLGIPIFYALVWPTGVSRKLIFFGSTLLSGFIFAMIAFNWYLAPLSTIGTSGEPTLSSQTIDKARFAAALIKRFYSVAVALLFGQVLLCKISQIVFTRNTGSTESSGKKTLSKIVWLIYAACYVYLSIGASMDDLELALPSWFRYPTILSEVLVATGIVTYAFDLRRPWLVRTWRWLFPLMVLALATGFFVDATIPNDFNVKRNGIDWFLLAIPVYAFVVPAYFLNWKLTRRRE